MEEISSSQLEQRHKDSEDRGGRPYTKGEVEAKDSKSDVSNAIK